MKESTLESRWSCLRSCIGVRLNLFRAIHDKGVLVDGDHEVLALRLGDYALSASLGFDPVYSFFYVRECGWYRSDLSRLDDQDVPDHIRYQLLDRFGSLLG